jgi:hypothetical protein
MMQKWHTRFAVLLFAATFLVVLPGCHKREHRTVKVHEETRTGEVQETPPGEMQVE